MNRRETVAIPDMSRKVYLTFSRFTIWLHAARPKTLWAAFAPVLIGVAMAYADGAFHAGAALAALLGALLIQVATNFCNDYADFRKGADTAERQGPLRVTQAGLIAPRTMLAATAGVFALACLAGLYLVLRCGWPLLAVGLLSIAAGIGYTAGPFPFGYRGWGDAFVLLFFGPVAVAGTYYVQALRLPLAPVAAGLAPGFLAVAILVVNNLRDVDGDARAGKRTLAVRFGRTFARWEYLLCLLAAACVPAALFLRTGRHPWSLLAIAIAPVALPALRRIFGGTTGEVLNPMLAYTARLLLLYSVLFSIGWIL